jgi:uncharacterized protein (TIGR02598 family)
MTFSSRLRSGFSLIEITLALGVAALSLLAVLGLLATGSQINRNAVEEEASGNILAIVAADLRATPRTSTTSGQYGIAIPLNPVVEKTITVLYFDSTGQFSTSLNSRSRYRLTVTVLPNGTGIRTATFIHLRVTWPAPANPTNTNIGTVETFIALDRN